MKLTKKKALDITIELWEWMAETGSDYKGDWHGWEKYWVMANNCALCECYAIQRSEDGGCGECPIQNCEDDFAYGKWDGAKTKPTRKKYAGLFLEQLKEIREAIK